MKTWWGRERQGINRIRNNRSAIIVNHWTIVGRRRRKKLWPFSSRWRRSQSLPPGRRSVCKVRMYSRNGLLFLYIHARWSNQQPPAPRDYHHHITLYHNNTTEARHYLFRMARLLTNSCWEKRVASVATSALLVRTRGQEVSIFCMNIAYWSHFIATY